MKTKFAILMLLLTLMACTGSRQLAGDYRDREIRFGIEAGLNTGGIVENTDMTVVENAAPDAFSGATRAGFHAGGHVTLPVGNNDLQLGIDYIHSPQTFTYNDEFSNNYGIREIALSQFVMPVTYNVNLLKSKFRPGTLCLKLGGALEYNFTSVEDNGSLLPGYSIKPFSAGFTLGVSALPVVLKNNARLGLSFDIYKGTRIFEDPYNLSEFAMPSSSYMKLSLIYQFK